MNRPDALDHIIDIVVQAAAREGLLDEDGEPVGPDDDEVEAVR
jgi:hypothetical protein